MSLVDIDYTIEEQKILAPQKRKNLNAKPVKDPSGKDYYPGVITKSFIDALFIGSIQWFNDNVFRPVWVRLMRQTQYNGQLLVLQGILNYEIYGDNTSTLITIPTDLPLYTPDTFIMGVPSDPLGSSMTVPGDSPTAFMTPSLQRNANDFIVNAPFAMPQNLRTKMEGIANKYKTAGTKPIFNYI